MIFKKIKNKNITKSNVKLGFSQKKKFEKNAEHELKVRYMKNITQYGLESMQQK
jgi:hypothetical protein